MIGMGWWIFKSAKEKYLGQLLKRLDAIERMMDEEREDDLLERIEGRIERIERSLTEAEAAPPEKSMQELADKTAWLKAVWESVPRPLRPLVNNLARQRLGKSVDELMQDSAALQAAETMIAGAAKGIFNRIQGPQTPTPTSDGGLLDIEKPMPTGMQSPKKSE